MPSEAEKANRAHEKKLASERAELEKEIKLERRRSRICLAASGAVPGREENGSPTHPISPVEPTGETPFKGMKNLNPFDEKKRAEKCEEDKILQQISDERCVNLSQARVLLAQNPQLAAQMQKPSHRRSSSLISQKQYNSMPVSPAYTSPTRTTIQETPGPRQGLSRIGSQDDAISVERRRSRSQVLTLVAPLILESVPRRPDFARADTTASIDTTLVQPRAARLAPLRPALKRIETNDSIDAHLSSPRSARFADMILQDSMRSLGIADEADEPVSPSMSIFGAKSNYSASLYSPALHQIDSATEYFRTPRILEKPTRSFEHGDLAKIREMHAQGIANQLQTP